MQNIKTLSLIIIEELEIKIFKILSKKLDNHIPQPWGYEGYNYRATMIPYLVRYESRTKDIHKRQIISEEKIGASLLK